MYTEFEAAAAEGQISNEKDNRLGLNDIKADWRLATELRVNGGGAAGVTPTPGAEEIDKVISGDIFPHLLNK